MLVGGLLFMMQLHGYQHSAYSDNYPLNKDDHSHVHADMASAMTPVALEGYQKPVKLTPRIEVETAPIKLEPAPSTHSHGDGNNHSH